MFERAPTIADEEVLRPHASAAIPRQRSHILARFGALLIAGVSALPLAAQEPVPGANPPLAAREAEAAKKADLHTLIRRLDDDEFFRRQAAQDELERRASEHILRHGKPPAWIAVLTPAREGKRDVVRDGERVLFEDAPIEVLRRLEACRAMIDACDARDLMSATRCEIPNDARTVNAVLASLSKRVGCPVAFYGSPTKFGETKASVPSGDLWKTIRALPAVADGEFRPYVSHAGAIDLYVEKKGERLMASEGALCAVLNVTNGDFRMFVEPKAEVQSWQVTRVELAYPDGLTTLHDVSGTSVSLPKDFAPGTGTTLQVTVAFSARRMRTYAVDPDSPSDIKTPAGTLKFKGVAKKPDELGAYHALISFSDTMKLPHPRLRCAGEDVKGEHLPAVSSTESLESYSCGFGRGNRPVTLRYAIVDDNPPYGSTGEFTQTFVFKHPR